jgi:hypothetical protein
MVETKILIDFEDIGIVECTLSDENNPRTYAAVLSRIPFESRANTWGAEIYFDTPITASIENSKKKVNIGDVAYWPPGKALCLFFGPTLASKGSEPVAASPVNVIGKVTKNIDVLSKVKDGTRLMVRFT